MTSLSDFLCFYAYDESTLKKKLPKQKNVEYVLLLYLLFTLLWQIIIIYLNFMHSEGNGIDFDNNQPITTLKQL